MIREPGDELKVYVQVPGVVVPAWLALVCGLVLLFSCLGFIISIFLVQDKREDIKTLSREIRILQVHVADIQNVMIREGKADRDDFADWEESSAPHNSKQEKGDK